MAAAIGTTALVFLVSTYLRGYPHTHLHGTTFVVVRLAWTVTFTSATAVGIRAYLHDGLRGRSATWFGALALAATVLGHLLNH